MVMARGAADVNAGAAVTSEGIRGKTVDGDSARSSDSIAGREDLLAHSVDDGEVVEDRWSTGLAVHLLKILERGNSDFAAIILCELLTRLDPGEREGESVVVILAHPCVLILQGLRFPGEDW